jgi:hypothetical protein
MPQKIEINRLYFVVDEIIINKSNSINTLYIGK